MLIVKMMSGEDAPDDDTRKTFTLFHGVTWVHFRRHEDGRALIEMTVAGRDDTDHYALDGNVYVMNENGKTISSFGCGEIPKSA